MRSETQGFRAGLLFVGAVLGVLYWLSPTVGKGQGKSEGKESKPPEKGAAVNVAAKTGVVRGRIVYQGEIPEPRLLVKQGDPSVKDSAIAAKFDIPDESLIIDPESRGVASVYVYLAERPKDWTPAENEKLNGRTVVQKGARYYPHALAARTNQRIELQNEDRLPHNTHPLPVRNGRFGEVIAPADEPRHYVFNKAEKHPFAVVCDFHAWEKCYWLITDHPFVAITDSEGRFEIADLPPGPHTFTLWHESDDFKQRKIEVMLDAGKTTDLGSIPFQQPAE
ncbi:MAG: carboxypeptidase-like regulatory domain-containing protein [Planctomycetota bacterium]|nr:carboxypeptidase-like regulatory domain-containing protein [Planctomycetota bacterium]